MKKHGTANILLVELVLVILFFMLCMPTIVRSFGDARLKSNYAQASSEAMIRAENMEERLAQTADAEGELEKGGFVREGEKWILRTEKYTLTAAPSEEKTEAGVLRAVLFSAETNTGRAMFELPAVKYIPGEVSP